MNATQKSSEARGEGLHAYTAFDMLAHAPQFQRPTQATLHDSLQHLIAWLCWFSVTHRVRQWVHVRLIRA